MIEDQNSSENLTYHEDPIPEMFYQQETSFFQTDNRGNLQSSEENELLRQSALKKLAEFNFAWGEAHEKGDGAFPSDLKAFEFYQKAFDAGNQKAAVKLGLFYLNGRGVQQNIENSFEFFKVGANADSCDACFYLGLLSFYGTLVPQDYFSAKYFFQRAIQINKKYTQAYTFLAYLYLNGLGVDSDLDVSFEYTMKGVELKDPNAIYQCYLLLKNYDENLSFEELNLADDLKEIIINELQNADSILKYFPEQIDTYHLANDLKYWNEILCVPEFWLCSASILEQPNALFDLGLRLIQEVQCEIENDSQKQYDEAIRIKRSDGYHYIEQAAEKNHLDALLYLGREYKIKVPKSAVDYFGKAALLGSEESRTELDVLYQNQKEVFSQKDYPSWDKAFARYHHPEGMYQWGLRLYLGNGVQQNIKEAFGWFLKSANTGYLDAIRRVIFCYEVGEGISKSIEKMNYWKSRLLEIEGNLSPQESQNL